MRLGCRRLPPRWRVMLFRGAGAGAVQQFPAERFSAQTPAPPDGFEFIAVRKGVGAEWRLVKAAAVKISLSDCGWFWLPDPGCFNMVHV